MVICDKYKSSITGLPDESILFNISISDDLLETRDDRDYRHAKEELDRNFVFDLKDFFYNTVVEHSETPKYYRDRKFLFINNHNVIINIEDGYRLALYKGKHVQSFNDPHKCVDFIWENYVDDKFRFKTFKEMSNCITLVRYNGTNIQVENQYASMTEYDDQHDVQFLRLKGLGELA